MNELCVEVCGLEKSFNGRKVVNDLSFSVEKGKSFGLLGHNGAGKSTTIEMILGLKKPDKGSASVLGKNVAKNKKTSFERIGVQLQSSNYQAGIKVEEACKERAALYKNPRDYKELLRQFNLDHLEKSPVNKLSGGEKQRLSVALTLIGNPEIVFLDELTTGLDVAARREVWKTLSQLKQRGVSLFLTTHYMEEAEKLCDELVILKQGTMVAKGTVKEIITASPYDNLEDAYLWYMGEDDMELVKDSDRQKQGLCFTSENKEDIINEKIS